MLPGVPSAGAALARLAIARGSVPDEATAVIYLDLLQDVDAACLAEACDELAREPRREFESALPDVGTIRARAEDVGRRWRAEAAHAKLLPAPHKSHDREPTFFCLDCLDEPNALRIFWCYGVGSQRVGIDAKPDRAHGAIHPCGRLQEHGPHTYAERCQCSETNPVIARARERERASKAKRVTSREDR